jgi:sugar transferase (PEP-CTERM/EpsH1 system associated)
VKILFLSQRVPYPPNRGDKITTWRLVERMKRAHDVRVVAFAHGETDEAAAQALRAKGIPTTTVRYHDAWSKLSALPLLATRTPLTLGVFGSRALQAHVDREIQGCDMAYAYSSSMGAFLEKHAGLPRVMHFGELDSDKWRQYAARSRFPSRWVYAREQRTLLAFERRIARAFTDNVLCTPLEQAIFRAEVGADVPSTVLRNGVDLQHFTPARTDPESGLIVFTGVMNYLPNADGCIWFAEEMLPRIQSRVPGAHFAVVGAHPTAAVERLGRLPGVTVTGFVDDTRDWLGRAAVSVAPLRIARGIQNKVLEAMAMGLPVVGTTSATQGVEGRDESDYLVRDDASSFGDAVIGLLVDPPRARALGARGRAFVEANYDWEVVFRPLDELLELCRTQGAKFR